MLTLALAGSFFVLYFTKNPSQKSTSAVAGSDTVDLKADWELGSVSNILATITNEIEINVKDKTQLVYSGMTAISDIRPENAGPVCIGGESPADNCHNTNWSVNYVTEGNGHYWQLDMKEKKTAISNVTISNDNCWIGQIHSNTVSYSDDGTTFINAPVTNTGDEACYQFDFASAIDARYIRITFSGSPIPPSTHAGAMIWSFQVYTGSRTATHTSATTQLDAGAHDTVGWTTFVPTATIPSNTSVSFKFRTSADASNWSSWSASTPYAASIDLSGLTQQRYLQVESTLTNTDGLSTPTLDSYTANYDYSDTAAPTCSDNIKNGDETGVDCGGSCTACPVTPTCDDNTQNGDETGVDCGGSCGTCEPDPTCNDNTQNGDETGVDCGGSCPACVPDPTCNDNTQNGDETGVDCGGSCGECPVPPTCTDGIQNQGEENTDCGGPCPACIVEPTCTDGIQNGSETGVDCGGSCGECKLCPNNELNECRAAVEAKYQQCLTNAGSDPIMIQACYSVPCTEDNACFTKCGLPGADVFDDIHVITPNGEEQYKLTEQMEIKWDYYRLKKKVIRDNYAVKFSLSTDSGKSYKEIKTLLPKGKNTGWIPDGTPYDYYVAKNKNGTTVSLNAWPEVTEGYLSYTWEIPSDTSLISDQVRIKLDPMALCSAGQSDESDRDFKITEPTKPILTVTITPSFPQVNPNQEVTYIAKSYIEQTDVTEATIFGFKISNAGEIVGQEDNKVTVRAGGNIGEFPDALTVTASYHELSTKVPAGLVVFANVPPPDECTGILCNIIEDIKGYSASSALSLLIASLLALGILFANALANGISLMRGSQLFSFFAKGLDKENAKGIVYDAFSGLPIPYAKVILINQEKTVDAIAVSGKDGKFALPVNPGGIYTIRIDKTGFLLFDSNAREQNGFLKYELKLNNNYFGEDYLADNEKYFFDKNIPLIPNSSSVALAQKTRLWENISRALLILNSVIIAVGFSFSILALAIDQSTFNIVVLALYVALLGFYLTKYLFYSGKGYGVVVNSEKQPLDLVLIRAIRNKDKKLIKTVASDKKGRFGLALSKGYYTIHASKEGLKQKEAMDLLIKSNLRPAHLEIDMETIILPAETDEMPEMIEKTAPQNPVSDITSPEEQSIAFSETDEQIQPHFTEQKHFDDNEEDRYAADASEIIENYR